MRNFVLLALVLGLAACRGGDDGGGDDGGADDDGGGAPISAGAGKLSIFECASAAFMNAAHI